MPYRSRTQLPSTTHSWRMVFLVPSSASLSPDMPSRGRALTQHVRWLKLGWSGSFDIFCPASNIRELLSRAQQIQARSALLTKPRANQAARLAPACRRALHEQFVTTCRNRVDMCKCDHVQIIGVRIFMQQFSDVTAVTLFANQSVLLASAIGYDEETTISSTSSDSQRRHARPVVDSVV